MTREKPSLNSASARELDKVEKQFDEFSENIENLTLDRMNQAQKTELEPQTKMSQGDMEKSKEIYLKPSKTISGRDKFNENYRQDYNFAKEYVKIIAENKEIIGETIEMWTKPFAGVPAEQWKVPVNKPVWAPRYVAEQIKRCSYHRLTMQQNVGMGADQMGSYFGNMVADNVIQRLDAIPAATRKSIFMGASNF
mgnify:CR=1 FL=1